MERRYEDNLELISRIAFEFMILGIEAKKKQDYDLAIQYFSVCWAFNALQEFTPTMYICDLQLQKLGIIDSDELYSWHEYGMKMVEFGNNLKKAVENIFNKNGRKE